ncbi:MAG: hypothetical protein NT062_33465 [Proteobacteria bacterium]|nr:hypothetical protein [Pseudomonadota bacterium]
MMRLLAIGALATIGCSAFNDGALAGRLESTGAAGTWVLDKGTCFSGEREQYFGLVAHAAGDTGAAVKIVKDQIRGWTAVVNVAATCKQGATDCKAIVLAADTCTTFRADATTTSTTVNDVRVVDGMLELDCAVEDGAIKGRLTFTYCH